MESAHTEAPEAEMTTKKEMTRMSRLFTVWAHKLRAFSIGLAALAISAACLGTLPVSAKAEPVWDINTQWGPTHLIPGETGIFEIEATNLGSSVTNGPVTIEVQLPPGVKRVPPANQFDALFWDWEAPGSGWNCSDTLNAGIDTVTCITDGPDSGKALQPLRSIIDSLLIRVAVDPDASGTHPNLAKISGGGAKKAATDIDAITISNDRAGFGLIQGSFNADVFASARPGNSAEHQAGAHPFELRVNFDFNTRKGMLESPFPGFVPDGEYAEPDEHARTVVTALPRGMIGNPEAVPKCAAKDFFRPVSIATTSCPANTQVGTLRLDLNATRELFGQEFFPQFTSRVAVYNLEPKKGSAADFGFTVGDYVGHITATLDPGHGYAIKATSPYVSDFYWVRSVNFTMWGVPGDPAHDAYRANPNAGSVFTAPDYRGYNEPFTAPIKPFLTLPMQCGDRGSIRFGADSWQQPVWKSENDNPEDLPARATSSASLEVTGCNDPRIRFNPEVDLQPTSREAGGPTGLQVDLVVPQREDTVSNADALYPQSGDVKAIPTPPMKKAVVTFPEGMTISPSAAQGLGSCSSAQLGLGTNDPVTCPDNSQYGTLTLHTPILPPDEPMQGQIYIAKQNDNPFSSFLALYLVIQDPGRGLLIKIPGKVDLDPVTGQIRTTFDDLPQFPVSDMQLNFKGGVRAALVNPSTCGTKTITAEFFSWADPGTPVTQSSSYDVTQKPDGSPCVTKLSDRPFKPELAAGTVNPSAGSYSPFFFRLTRSDDDQEFSRLGVTMPPGLLAKISGLSKCPEAGIAQVSAPLRTGAEEAAVPSCPASSQIGTTEVGAGVGVPLTYVPGKIFLAGPYGGSPLSMVVITPAMVGPYDLGVIAVRSAIDVNRETAQVKVFTDPFPQIFKGIPVRIRDIRVKVDRPETIINPTSCAPTSVEAHVTGTGGDVNSDADDTAADLSSRFQAANCAALPFKPNLSFKLKGGTKRGQFPAFQAVLKARPGDANIAGSTVVLPRSEFIEQGHIRTVCTRVQFAANQCPPGSIYGHAKATTPLFDKPLEGPVYLRSNGGERLLPDLVVSLNGEIDVALTGFVDSVKGRVRNRFAVIPDAPVTKFVLNMQGGKRGLLVNHLDLCEVTSRADVKLIGQNGKVVETRPKMGTSCGKGRKGRGREGRSR